MGSTKKATHEAQNLQINPFSSEHLKYMHQLRDMRMYFENHKYYEEYDGFEKVTNMLGNICDGLDHIAENIGDLIGFEVKNEAYFHDPKEEERGIA